MIRLPNEIILDELGSLSRQHQFVFCASCCERLYPLYKMCYEGIESDKPEQYGQCLDDIWQVCVEGLEKLKSVPRRAILEEEQEDEAEECNSEKTFFWRNSSETALWTIYKIEDEIPIRDMQGCCLECVCLVLEELGVWKEYSFNDNVSLSGNLYWGYHDQPKMLEEWAVQFEIVRLLKKYSLDEEGIARIKKYSQDHPVIGPLEARKILVMEEGLFPRMGKEMTTMIIDLEHAVEKGEIPSELKKQVVTKLTAWSAIPSLPGGIWHTTQSEIEPVLEPVQEYLISICLAICRMSMLEYMMHRLADQPASNEERAFALKMIAKCSPVHEHVYRSANYAPPPPLPRLPGGFVTKVFRKSPPSDHFIATILDALDLLAAIPDPEIPWLIRRYVDFPIPEVAEHAQECLEKRENFWSMEK